MQLLRLHVDLIRARAFAETHHQSVALLLNGPIGAHRQIAASDGANGHTIRYNSKLRAVNNDPLRPLSFHRFIPGVSMHREAHDVLRPPASTGTVPRALWIGGGLLSLATAGFAGALIMRSVETAPVSQSTAPTVASVEAAPAPVVADVPAASQHAKSAERHPVSPSKASTTASVGAKPAPVVAAVPASSHHEEPAAQGIAVAQADARVQNGATQVVPCASCGVVESVNAVQQQGLATGLGAVAGGVLGGVVGHQMGGGKGKTAMTALGAIGGVLAGNEVEKRARSETLFNVQVRMEDGSTRVFQQSQSMAIGTHVVVDGTKLRVGRDTATSDQSNTVRTAALPGAST